MKLEYRVSSRLLTCCGVGVLRCSRAACNRIRKDRALRDESSSSSSWSFMRGVPRAARFSVSNKDGKPTLAAATAVEVPARPRNERLLREVGVDSVVKFLGSA